MGKTNFTKVEEALAKGLDQQAIDQLLAQTGRIPEGQIAEEHRLLLCRLHQDLKWLLKQDNAIHTKLGLEREELLRLVELEPKGVKAEEWPRLATLLATCQKLKPDIQK